MPGTSGRKARQYSNHFGIVLLKSMHRIELKDRLKLVLYG